MILTAEQDGFHYQVWTYVQQKKLFHKNFNLE